MERDLKVLEQSFVQRDENNNFTNSSVSPLGLLLQGAEAQLFERPSSMLTGGFSGNKNINEDVRFLNIKMDRMKAKLDVAESRLKIHYDEYDILKRLYQDHLNAYENAIQTKQALEDKIKELQEH